jgi:hypothetical protein
MKIIFLSLLVLSISQIINAQSDTASSVLFWQARHITWEDFKGVPPRGTESISEFSYLIGYRPFEKRIDDMDVKWIEAYCYMDRFASWVKEENRNPSILLYNQTIFDIVELFTRKFQDDINKLSGSQIDISNKCNLLLRDYLSRIEAKIATMDLETVNGTNSRAVEYWNQKTQSELQLQEKQLLPDYKLGRFGLGLTFDLGYGILSGNSSNYFGNNFDLAFGFDIAYKPVVLYLRAILGFNSVKQDFYFDNKIWTTDLNTGIAIPELSVGYPIFSNNDFSLTPFAGVGVTEFSVFSNDEAYKKQRMTGFAGILGFNIDYMFGKELNLLNNFIFFRDKSNWVIRTRFTAVPFNIDDKIKGWSFNFTIGIGGFANSIKL